MQYIHLLDRLCFVLQPLLRPASFPYGALLALRRRLYAKGTLFSYTTRVPCVSVGNIALGGTGKTPLIGWLLDWANKKALRATVLSRGYGGNPGTDPMLVTPATPPEIAGDEPLLLAKSHQQAHILVCPERAKAAAFAERYLRPDIFLLDDGMQHLAIKRHVNLVLLRPQDLTTQWNKVLPAGTWRENKTALASATAFLIKLPPDKITEFDTIVKAKLEQYNRPVFTFSLTITKATPLIQQTHHTPLGPLDIANYILVSGVGEPLQVYDSATKFMSKPPAQHVIFQDHHPYDEDDAHALSQHGLPVLCTPKDAVKLTSLAHALTTPVWVMQPSVQFGGFWFTEHPFAQWWQQTWQTIV